NAMYQLNDQVEAYPVNVKIFKVDGGYRWAIEEDAFAFIDESEIEQYRQQLDRELQQLAAALDDLEPVDESKEHERGSLVTPIAEPELQGVSYQEEPVPVGNITAYTQ